MLPKTVPMPTYNQVTKHNLAAIQPMIVQLLKRASFIGLDAEFTGLGSNLRDTRSKDVQERYTNLSSLARSHALVAFGLSVFILDEKKPPKHHPANEEADNLSNTPLPTDPERAFKVHNFNFSMLNENDYMVSPRSMLFLAENGLDLNQWILEGIPYTGGDRLTNDGGRGNPNGIMRSIFKRIMSQRVPVVVHNGFYADLPPKLATFTADLSDMFPGGLYDTKYVSDYITREKASFLSYLFRKYERMQARSKAEHISGNFNSKMQRLYSSFDVQGRLPVSIPAVYHGVCKTGTKCDKSHDLDVILDAEEAAMEAKKNKRRKKNTIASGSGETTIITKASDGSNSTTEVLEVSITATAQSDDASEISTATNPKEDTDIIATSSGSSENAGTIVTNELMEGKSENAENAAVASSSSRTDQSPMNKTPRQNPAENDNCTKAVSSSSNNSTASFHSAYFDAFMTGTIFAHQLNEHYAEEMEKKAKNKIYLIGKSYPLNVEKSAFSKFSPSHERQREQQ
ncbi:Target of EGR1, member 1 (Nuclear) [Podila humilis]|nr:Target of EGR1, member 1 (Nuclear) [Podila humilis]